MQRWMKRVTELNIEHFRRLLAKGLGERPVIEDLLRKEQERLSAIEAGAEAEPPAISERPPPAKAASGSDRD